ncbi:MAG: hypothetical protein N3A63_02795 [Bacteroidetes bacterium]|nr:hypothetical protein [Bacteroidota bacterium]
MRKRKLVLVVLLVPIITYSQGLTLTFGGGLSVPLSENNMSKYFKTTTKFMFADCWNYGFNLTAGIDYKFNEQFTAFATVDYSSFSVNKSMVLKRLRLPAGTYVQDGEFTTVAGKVGMRYYLPVYFIDRNVKPYISASAGIMNLASDKLYVLIDAYTNFVAAFKNSNVLCGSLGVGVDVIGGESSALFIQLGLDVANTKGGSLYYVPLIVGFRGAF